MQFAALGLPEPILRGVRAAGYTTPTPIQAEAIPVILPGHDLIAAAQTGSGKTAAFLLPILARLMTGTRALRALVLCPTRELAAQIEEAGREYGRFSQVRVAAVYGGVPIGPQERTLRNDGVDLLVATPGRLLDLHGRQSVSLDDIEVLVLDEADRMVDMGFAPDLKRILNLLPDDRQTLMFSATMPRELNTVAREAMEHPKRIQISPPSEPASSIIQRFYPTPSHLKLDLLDRLLVEAGKVRAIVFARTRRNADRLATKLKGRGHAVAVLHGDRAQSQRERALSDFKRGRARVMVATDIASRGIDVDHVTHVINYDVPRTPEDYVHRIGRTGRMDASGMAITFVSPEEREQATDVEHFLGRKVERVKLAGFDYAQHREVAPHEPRGGHGDRPRAHGESHGGRGTHAPAAHGRAARAEPHSKARTQHAAAAKPRATSAEAAHGRRRKVNGTDRRSRKRM
jgi:ATP-dependent RNA helicase RhlE